jgi:co-chaperonin GroES (HSP10)
MNELNINPLGSLILVEEIQEKDAITESGLVISTVSSDQVLKRGIVIKIGPGELNPYTGAITPVQDIEVDSVVYYSPNNATEVKDNFNKQYYFVNSKMLFGYSK